MNRRTKFGVVGVLVVFALVAWAISSLTDTWIVAWFLLFSLIGGVIWGSIAVYRIDTSEWIGPD